MSVRWTLICTDCGRRYEPEEVEYLCPDCRRRNTPDRPPYGVLKTIYDYGAITRGLSGFHGLEDRQYLDLLPVDSPSSLAPLKIGDTPLYRITSIDRDTPGHHIYLKDESVNPTFSLKDRASGLVSAVAAERGRSVIVAASTGNAGSSLAGVCASRALTAVVLVPASAPRAKLVQMAMYGAIVVPIDGTYDQAFELSIALTETLGWYNRNTAFNPFTIEGKKTVSFELFRDLGEQAPERVFVPCGDGVVLSGVYKGFEDLLELGFIDRVPEIVAVQSEGSDNLVRNLGKPVFQMKPSSTLADSISVDVPRNFRMAQRYLSEYNGRGITVSDDEIVMASRTLSRNTGLFAEPAAAAAFAGYLAVKSELPAGSRNVILLTGCGLKDLDSCPIRIPESVMPEASAVERFVSRHPL